MTAEKFKQTRIGSESHEELCIYINRGEIYAPYFFAGEDKGKHVRPVVTWHMLGQKHVRRYFKKNDNVNI